MSSANTVLSIPIQQYWKYNVSISLYSTRIALLECNYSSILLKYYCYCYCYWNWICFDSLPFPPEAAMATRSPLLNSLLFTIVSWTSLSNTSKKHFLQSISPVLGLFNIALSEHKPHVFPIVVLLFCASKLSLLLSVSSRNQ